MKRGAYAVCVLLLCAGCSHPVVQFCAGVVPDHGHIPFEARIIASPISGSYRYDTPDGIVYSSQPTLDVLVDELEWKAEVSCVVGGGTYTDTATAYGTNAPPRILRPFIKNSCEMWPTLCPLERTMVKCRVDYDREWWLVEAEFDCELTPEPDSIYCPPLERTPGGGIVFHVYDTDNAFLVYPTRVAPSPSGLPYRPTAYEEGYPAKPGWSGNIYYMDGFREQTATLTLIVADEWGRQSTATFEVWVGGKHGDFDYR